MSAGLRQLGWTFLHEHGRTCYRTTSSCISLIESTSRWWWSTNNAVPPDVRCAICRLFLSTDCAPLQQVRQYGGCRGRRSWSPCAHVGVPSCCMIAAHRGPRARRPRHHCTLGSRITPQELATRQAECTSATSAMCAPPSVVLLNVRRTSVCASCTGAADCVLASHSAEAWLPSSRISDTLPGPAPCDGLSSRYAGLSCMKLTCIHSGHGLCRGSAWRGL